MEFELISAEEFGLLPEDNEECFVEFEAICRRNMIRMINDNTSGSFDRAVPAQYMAAVGSVAVECGLPHLMTEPVYENDSNFYEKFSRFSLAVQGDVARIRIRGRRSLGSLSVQLLDNTRTKIQHYVTRLREIIDTSNLPIDRKVALRSKLDELVDELEKPRLNLGKAMLVLSGIIAGLSGATTIASEGHSAVTQIMCLIGIDKQSENAAQSRLQSSQKFLPGPAINKSTDSQKPTASGWENTNELDDEIPF